MTKEALQAPGMRVERGGVIPGTPGLPAFAFTGPAPSALPVLIAVPHAGRTYPRALLERMRNPAFAALRLEDRHADTLAESVAAQTGAGLLVAHAPRALVDLNRAPDDVDWEMFGLTAPERDRPPAGQRARSGLGLVPRRLPGFGELWKRRHAPEDLDRCLADVHSPWHAAVARELAALRERWGVAVLLDFHSMPPLAPSGGCKGAQVVVGDRFGASCHGALAASAFSHFAASGWLAAHNRPYAGGYGLQRHADPAGAIHAVQIEIDRACYLDSRLEEPGAGLAEVAGVLAGVVRALADEAVRLASGETRLAAE
ncbi:MAG TPA: N-formylglutamate amidohydrolase [Novosphingobium sp.]|nr:N-formylglutamate amidohydrolase [Novosphingobium sp.]